MEEIFYQLDFLRVFTIFVWLAAIIVFYLQVNAYPKEERRERVLYSFGVMSYIVHVIIFYVTLLIVHPIPGDGLFTAWSNVLRLHGGFAILSKEIIAVIRINLYKKGENK